jgi:hypothetical protein
MAIRLEDANLCLNKDCNTLFDRNFRNTRFDRDFREKCPICGSSTSHPVTEWLPTQ